MVKDLCGKNSDEYAAIANFELGVWTRQGGIKNVDYALSRKHNAMVGLLDNCIDKIKRNGIQSSSKNIKYAQPIKIKNKHIVTIILILGLIVTVITQWSEISDFYNTHVKP